jgi:hypothetical protein
MTDSLNQEEVNHRFALLIHSPRAIEYIDTHDLELLGFTASYAPPL